MLLRLTVGAVYAMHGYHALAVAGIAAVAAATVRLGYPATVAEPLAWYLVVAHLAGGALLVLGLWARAAALAQLPVMLSALFLVHLDRGFFVSSPLASVEAGGPAGGYEYALLVTAATLALALLGGGALSLDAWRAHARRIDVP